MRSTNKLWWGALGVCASVLALLLVGCGTQQGVPTATPNREAVQQQSTPTPPPWQEPFVPVTLDNVDTVRQVGRLDPPTADSGSIFTHAFSIDGTRLAGLNRSQIIVWDVVLGERVFAVPRVDAQDVFFSPDKTELYTLDGDGNVNVLDGDTGELLEAFLTHPDYTGGAYTYRPSDGLLAVVSIQGDIRVWDTLARQAIANMETTNLEVNTLALAPTGTFAAIGDSTGNGEVWDWATDERVLQMEQDTEFAVQQVTFSPDGTHVAVANDEDIRVWDVPAAALDNVLLTGRGGSADVLQYSPDGTYIINSGTAEAMNIWDAAAGDLLAALPELGGEPTRAAFSPSGDVLLAAVFQGGVYVIDMTSLNDDTVRRAQLDATPNVIDVAWSDDGRTLALFAADGSVLVYGLPQAPAAVGTEEASAD